MAVSAQQVVWREAVRASDEGAIRRMAVATGFFRDDEVEIACELVRERLHRGEASGYEFVLVDDAQGELMGYACYGPIACTVGSYDLFWIIVNPSHQGAGLGRLLVGRVERAIARLGGRHVYIETSSLPKYEPTRRFYERCGYDLAARLADFYQVGDDKLVFLKKLVPGD